MRRTGSKRLLVLLILCFCAALPIGYLLLCPAGLEPEAWDPPAAPPLKGVFEANDRLRPVERLSLPGQRGPETVAIDEAGNLYAGVESGQILKIPAAGGVAEVFARTGGRPLGLHFDGSGALIVADARKGLLRINSREQATTLATGHGGVDFRFTNDVDIAADGTIYFSDASSKFSQALLDIVEHGANGRLLAYHPETGTTELLLDHLYFANGVAVSTDQSFVLVCETSAYRVKRYWLAGPKAGTWDIFLENLPGSPDGISSDGQGRFWLALYGTRPRLLDALLPSPFLRKVIACLPLTWFAPKHYGFILGVDREGNIVQNLQDSSEGAYAPVTSVQQHAEALYLGSTVQDAIGRLPVPGSEETK